MRALRVSFVVVFLFAAARAQAGELSRPRVVEVITAAGDVRGAVQLDGALWLATSGGLVRASLELDEQARFTTRDGLPSNDLRAIVARGDTLELDTPRGLVRARIDGGALAAVTLLDGAFGAPPSHTPHRVWLGNRILELGPAGAALFAVDGHWMATLIPNGLPSPAVTRVAAAPDGVYLFTVEGPAHLRIDRAAGTLDLAPLGEGTPVARETQLSWAGWKVAATPLGLAFNRDDETLLLTVADGLPADEVAALAVTSDGLWAATSGGLARLVSARTGSKGW
jgi:hypothetical protein